jgi:hypothetical protein
MSLYKQTLPKVFPYVVIDKPDGIRDLVSHLLSIVARPDGSSFAVTVDGPDDRWLLWLSEASMKYLLNEAQVQTFTGLEEYGFNLFRSANAFGGE